jgi:hypothetical protein
MRGATLEAHLQHELQLMLFAEVLARSVEADTIRVYIQGVRSLHVSVIGYVPWGVCLRLQRVLAGIKRRQQKPVKKRAPVTLELLTRWSSSFNLALADDRALWAAFLLAFFALLRKSEYTVPERAAFLPERHLSRGDVTFHWAGGALDWMEVHRRSISSSPRRSSGAPTTPSPSPRRAGRCAPSWRCSR